MKFLIKSPKDPRTWLKNWSVAIEKAAAHGIIIANRPWTWIISFIKIIKYWKPS